MKRTFCLLILLTATTGCESLLHELQPHRLWRLNYQQPSGRADNAFFSVSDPIDNLTGTPTEARQQ